MNRRKIRSTVCILLILLVLSVPFLAQTQGVAPPSDPVHKAVTRILTQQQAAWNGGDILAFMTGYWKSPRLSFASSSGVSRGYEAVLARYERSYPDKAAMGHLEFSDLEVHPLADSAAMVLGKWHLKRESGDVGGVFTLVFQRFPEGWKIIHDHTSQSPPAKP